MANSDKTKLLVGKNFTSKYGESYVVIDAKNSSNVLVEFEDGTQVTVYSVNLRKGNLKNPNRKVVRGIGYLGTGSHAVCKDGTKTSAYVKWHGMIERVYGQHKKSSLCYQDCKIVPEWHNFQNFATWYYAHIQMIEGYEGKVCLDKDLLLIGSTIYSPETCCLLPYEINIAIQLCTHFRFDKQKRMFHASLTRTNDLVHHRSAHIGYYPSENECLSAYSLYKDEYIAYLGERYEKFLQPNVLECLKNFNTKERFIQQQKRNI